MNWHTEESPEVQYLGTIPDTRGFIAKYAFNTFKNQLRLPNEPKKEILFSLTKDNDGIYHGYFEITFSDMITVDVHLSNPCVYRLFQAACKELNARIGKIFHLKPYRYVIGDQCAIIPFPVATSV